MNGATSTADCDAGMTLNFKLSQLSSKLAYMFLNGCNLVYVIVLLLMIFSIDIFNSSEIFFFF
jgi:hypothetical protein